MLGLLSPTSPASCVLDLIAAPNQRQGVKRHKRGGFDCNGCPGCNLLKRLERAPSCQRHGLSPQLSSALKRWHLSAPCLSKTLPRKLIHLHLPRQACVSCDRTAKISTSKGKPRLCHSWLHACQIFGTSRESMWSFGGWSSSGLSARA